MISRAKKYVAVLLVFVCVCMIFSPQTAYAAEMCIRDRFIGQKSKANAEDYHDFLEEMGYSVFYKNINLNYSVGKVRWRPWARCV